MKKVILACCLLLPLGCATPIKLNPLAHRVKIVKYILQKDLKHLEEVAFVECKLGENARSRRTNIEACENKLKNDAYKMGGTIILLKENKQYKPTNLFMVMALADQQSYCENCILMNGVVYKKKQD